MTCEEIADYQLKKARKVVRYAAGNSRFFKRYYRESNLNDVWSLPPVKKKIMMDNLTEYNTVGLTKEEMIDFCLAAEKTRNFSLRLKGINISLSSGTSGNKGVEITTRYEENYLRAAYLSRFHFLSKEKLNLAFILRVSSPALRLKRFGHQLTYISQLNVIEKIREELEKLQPNALSAPPSLLKIIGKEVDGGRLKIKPKTIISYAEVLYPDVKKYLEEIFGCAVHQIYKCTEGAIANTCQHGNLHINEDLVAVQTFNADFSPTPEGVPCFKMIITDLHKTSQPIIRYELNDIITIGKTNCACGSSFRVIEQIQGRADDLFWGIKKNSKRLQFIFPDYISRAIITSSDDIEEYQAIQTSPEVVLVRIIPRDCSKNEHEIIAGLEKNIQRLFDEYRCKRPKVKVVFEKPEVNPNSMKVLRIHRNFEVNDEQI
jgi:putative adenylate-forming enzyme